MRRKTVITSLVVLLLALLPTYLIIYNTVRATGLPDFSQQQYVEILEPDKHLLPPIYNQEDDYFLIVGVLSNLNDAPEKDPAVEKDAQYKITFVSKNGTRTHCRIYAALDRLSAYVETATGKLYELYMPDVMLNEMELSPSTVGYARKKADGTWVESENFAHKNDEGYQPFIYTVQEFSHLSRLSFAEEDMRLSASLRSTPDDEIATYSTMDGLLSHSDLDDVRFVYLSLEWHLEKDVKLSTLYIFRIGE